MTIVSRTDLRAAAVRALRTAVQAFLVVYPGDRLLDYLSGTAALDISLARAAAVSAAVAAVSFVWRAFVDPTPLPSLQDADQKAG